jgi:hypothetical protein
LNMTGSGFVFKSILPIFQYSTIPIGAKPLN